MNLKNRVPVSTSFGLRKGDTLVISDGIRTEVVTVRSLDSTSITVGQLPWWKRLWHWFLGLWPFRVLGSKSRP